MNVRAGISIRQFIPTMREMLNVNGRTTELFEHSLNSGEVLSLTVNWASYERNRDTDAFTSLEQFKGVLPLFDPTHRQDELAVRTRPLTEALKELIWRMPYEVAMDAVWDDSHLFGR